MDQTSLVAVASIVVAVLGGAAVALKISFTRRNEARGDRSSVVTVEGTGNIAAGGNVTFGPPQSTEPGQQSVTD